MMILSNSPVVEMVSSEIRTTVSSVTAIMWAIGLSILPLTVYLSRSWVIVTIISAAVGVVMVCLVT